MKRVFYTSCLPLSLVFATLLPTAMPAIAAAPMQLAQVQSNYNQSMLNGYDATRQRRYPVALQYFKAALQERPSDRYATTAIHNVEQYAQRRNRIGYIPKSLGEPSRRVPGGSRGGSCQPQRQQLTALIPEMDQQLTTSAHPSFLFYVPPVPSKSLELVLQDETDQVLYQKTLNPIQGSGIVRVSLPTGPNAPALQVGKTYYWSFSIVCNPQERAGDLVVTGAIKRVPLDTKLATELAVADPQTQATLYAAAGFWQDALTILAELRYSKPSDARIKTDWEDLLSSVGLAGIARESLVSCCTIQEPSATIQPPPATGIQ